MGGYHGAELCELVGLFMMKGLTEIIPPNNIGIYRDDGLAAIRKHKRQEAEKIKKKICEYANSIGLKITIENPVEETDFLDLNFNLKDHTFSPYRKPNNELRYVSNFSNHPKTILKQIPNMIEKRLSKHSSSKDEFNKIKQDYNEALRKSGYKKNFRISGTKY